MCTCIEKIFNYCLLSENIKKRAKSWAQIPECFAPADCSEEKHQAQLVHLHQSRTPRHHTGTFILVELLVCVCACTCTCFTQPQTPKGKALVGAPWALLPCVEKHVVGIMHMDGCDQRRRLQVPTPTGNREAGLQLWCRLITTRR